MAIPNDPNILMSYLNTQLRDNFSSLMELCKVQDCDAGEIIARMKTIGYQYDSEKNQFVISRQFS
ncbi:MAG: DUF4250 domain-containing protein [Ruminococcus sp.]|nr:DUF4250 domain-containing protein [Ruminococcus sp.]MCD7958723.1 DUF4250 domain-containing protein [Ruminococcus sp.]